MIGVINLNLKAEMVRLKW